MVLSKPVIQGFHTLPYVWLAGFGYGFARALVREGAPYSNPEPS